MLWVLVAGGVLRWVAFWSAPVVSWRPAHGDGGLFGVRSRLVDFWIMHCMVMDETQHLFPGGGVGELLRVCQQEVFAVYHFGPCSADCFYLEVRCCPDRVSRVFGEVSVWGLCHRSSHSGFHRATLVRIGSCLLRSWMRRFCRWAGMHAGRSAEW